MSETERKFAVVFYSKWKLPSISTKNTKLFKVSENLSLEEIVEKKKVVTAWEEARYSVLSVTPTKRSMLCSVELAELLVLQHSNTNSDDDIQLEFHLHKCQLTTPFVYKATTFFSNWSQNRDVFKRLNVIQKREVCLSISHWKNDLPTFFCNVPKFHPFMNINLMQPCEVRFSFGYNSVPFHFQTWMFKDHIAPRMNFSNVIFPIASNFRDLGPFIYKAKKFAVPVLSERLILHWMPLLLFKMIAAFDEKQRFLEREIDLQALPHYEQPDFYLYYHSLQQQWLNKGFS